MPRLRASSRRDHCPSAIPAMVTDESCPSFAWCNPASPCIKVVLPQPFRPRIAQHSPGLMVRFRLRHSSLPGCCKVRFLVCRIIHEYEKSAMKKGTGRPFLCLQIFAFPSQPAMEMAFCRFRIITQQFSGHPPRRVEQIFIPFQVSEAQHGQAALARAQEFAGTAQLQIAARYFKAIGVLKNYLEPLACGCGERLLIHQYAYTTGCASSDASAQLVQLCKAHAFCMLDHHQRRIGHIHTHFDHCCRYEEMDFTSRKCFHYMGFFLKWKPAMHQ